MSGMTDIKCLCGEKRTLERRRDDYLAVVALRRVQGWVVQCVQEVEA